uniref:Uncharacterized protein n=1 Tax=Rhodosorus marinus TaxID=101924 RepID=A0A7S0BJ03_9RHOD|mmetsp:Transcript_17510/g.25141  ORF Transcript_17510/g.25141 Transcript_17510/m.25141 type:complete len:123 (+) Transcript_17510:175-543(+)
MDVIYTTGDHERSEAVEGVAWMVERMWFHASMNSRTNLRELLSGFGDLTVAAKNENVLVQRPPRKSQVSASGRDLSLTAWCEFAITRLELYSFMTLPKLLSIWKGVYGYEIFCFRLLPLLGH